MQCLTEEAVDFVRHLENQTIKEIPTSVTFECEITKANCKLAWAHDGDAVYNSDKYTVEMDGKVHRYASGATRTYEYVQVV